VYCVFGCRRGEYAEDYLSMKKYRAQPGSD
jgi:hypothetical protein